MAHLVWCWCGKQYRCDIEHPPQGNVLTFMEPIHESNCPDQLIHGKRFFEFKRLSTERFLYPTSRSCGKSTDIAKEFKNYSEYLSSILEANSMKEQK